MKHKNILDNHAKAYQGQILYDFDNEIQLKWYPNRIIGMTKSSNSILELGLGHGITTEIFSKHYKRHVVLDASKSVIDHFNQKLPGCKAEIIETFFETFETEERFDIIVLGYVLEHVDDPVKLLKIYKRFLKPDGKIFLTVPNAEVLNRRLGHLAGMLPNILLMSENDILLGHKRYYTVKTLTDDIEKAGYRVKSMEGIYLKPFTTKQILSLNFDQKIIDAMCKIGIDYPELSCGIMAEIKANG